jgi:hypothetical protein
MKQRLSILVLFALVSALALAACGGGGKSGPPVEMQSFGGSSFDLSYPKDWKESKIDMFGLSMVILGRQEFNMANLEGLDFNNFAAKDPLVLIMSVPQEMAGDMGFEDIDSALEEFDGAIDQGDVEILEQGDATLGDAKGKMIVAKGTDPDMGDIGLRLVAAQRPDGGAVVFMGVTPAENRDQNLAIFEYMHNSFKFN